MADDIDDNEQAAPAAQPGVMKWAVSIGLAIFLAVLAAQVAAPIVSRMILGDPDAVAVEDDMAEDGAAVAVETDFTELDPAIYVPLDPPLLASFETDGGETRYLQMSIQVMGRDEKAMDAVRMHAPAIRNAFLFLMSNHSYDDVATVAGKEQLRAEMLAEVQAIIRRNTGTPGVEEIYFTSLVLQ